MSTASFRDHHVPISCVTKRGWRCGFHRTTRLCSVFWEWTQFFMLLIIIKTEWGKKLMVRPGAANALATPLRLCIHMSVSTHDFVVGHLYICSFCLPGLVQVKIKELLPRLWWHSRYTVLAPLVNTKSGLDVWCGHYHYFSVHFLIPIFDSVDLETITIF